MCIRDSKCEGTCQHHQWPGGRRACRPSSQPEWGLCLPEDRPRPSWGPSQGQRATRGCLLYTSPSPRD
eukprot:13381076-Alexandrium_andersonii.AAC.1